MTVEYGQATVPSVPVDARYTDPRAHELRARYLAVFGGDEIPVPVRTIAEDLLGLRVEEADLGDCSGQLIPSERLIVLNAKERVADDGTPVRRHRFTLAHELGHWICHALGSEHPAVTYCRAADVEPGADRELEREANVFAAELLMPAPAVQSAWHPARDVDHCARVLEVSRLAAEWRLYSLGLVRRRPS